MLTWKIAIETRREHHEAYENQDEDLKVIDVSPIKSLFWNMNLDETEYDLPLPRRCSKNSESLDLYDEIDESGIERNGNFSAHENFCHFYLKSDI